MQTHQQRPPVFCYLFINIIYGELTDKNIGHYSANVSRSLAAALERDGAKILFSVKKKYIHGENIFPVDSSILYVMSIIPVDNAYKFCPYWQSLVFFIIILFP